MEPLKRKHFKSIPIEFIGYTLIIVMFAFSLGLLIGRFIWEPKHTEQITNRVTTEGVEPILVLENVPLNFEPVLLSNVQEKDVNRVEDVLLEEPTVNEVIEEPEIDPQPISRDFNVFQPCGYSADELCYMLSEDTHQGLLPYVDTYLYAEEIYGVNAFYLICKTGYESGWGKYMADTNNIGGWTDGNGGFMSFDSVDECILHIAEKLSTEYRDAVGDRLEDVCWRYCPTSGYTEMVMQIMRERTAVIEEMA